MRDDFRQAFRALAKRPGYAALAVSTLALGLGANAALFTVLNAVIRKPLPFREPERLHLVRTLSRVSGETLGVSIPDFEEVAALPRAFERTALVAHWTFNLSGRAVPERLVGARVSADFFEALGVPPLLGRALGAADDRKAAEPTAVLSYRLWQRLFGGAADAIGRQLTLNGIGTTVVGVMPASFRFPEDVELWATVSDQLAGLPRTSRFPIGVVRLRGDATAASAQALLETLSKRLQVEHPQSNAERVLRLQPLHESVVGEVRPVLLLLSGAVALLFFLACVNLGHLLLAQAAARRRDDAIRLALGASGFRLLRLQAAENLLVASLGALAGLAIAHGAAALLRASPPKGLPRLHEVEVDSAVAGFAAALALSGAAALALLRVFTSTRGTSSALAAGRSGALSGPHSRLRSSLVVAEVALAAILLVGGGLLLRSLRALSAVDAGFDPTSVVTASVFLGPPQYRTLAQQKTYVKSALLALEAMPGVEAVGAASALPLAAQDSSLRIAIEGRTFEPDRAPSAFYRVVSPRYFETLRIPLLRGRSLADSDDENAQPVALINQAAARRLFPGEDPLGRRIGIQVVGSALDWLSVVGVVGDVRSRALAREEEPVLYGTVAQRRAPWLRWASIAIRTPRPEREALSMLRETLLRIDPNQPVHDLTSVAGMKARALETQRLQAALIDSFGALALVLAAIGTYGVLSHGVQQRTAEIGVRVALGATSADVARLVLSLALRPVLLGLALGLPAAALAARLLEAQLFGVRAGDPLTFTATAALLASASVLAALAPARRALRVDPAVALRES
jgi:putative ABC transport system permease protein